MTSSPSAARIALGAELRRLREAAGLRVEDAAKVLECSTAKISRLETGKGRTYFRDVRDLLAAYGQEAEARLDELSQLVEAGSREDWTDEYRDVSLAATFSEHLSPDGGGRFVTLEQQATELKTFQPDYVPGILQTAEYTDAISQSVTTTRSSTQRARFVAFRMRRQQEILARSPRPKIIAVMSELTLLRSRMIAPEVLRRQLQALLDRLQGDLSWIDFRVTLLEQEPPDAPGGPFYILKFVGSTFRDTVYLEGREEPDYIEASDDVARYDDRLDRLVAASLSREETFERLRRGIRSLS